MLAIEDRIIEAETLGRFDVATRLRQVARLRDRTATRSADRYGKVDDHLAMMTYVRVRRWAAEQLTAERMR